MGKAKGIKAVLFVLILIIALEVMNGFLILTGSALYQLYPPRFAYGNVLTGIAQELIQALLGAGLFLLLIGGNLSDMGLNLANGRKSLRYFIRFAALWSVVIALYCFVAARFLPGVWDSIRSQAVPSGGPLAASLLFQSFFPGFGEEILFRGLVVALCVRFVPGRGRFAELFPGLVSAALFAVAHVYFRLDPFAVSHFDPAQFATALFCGFIYTAGYRKTGSLLFPFLAHNFSNLSSTLAGYAIASF